jgi:membrane associated rhomboid family serine protease
VIPLKDNIPTRVFPVVTVVLIVINVVVYFAFQQGTFSTVDEGKVVKYAVIPYEITHSGKHCGEVEGRIICEGKTVTVISQEGTRQVKVPEGALDRIGATPDDDQPPTWLTLLTAMFMHGNLLHIAGNMLFLWIFGNNVEDSMGRVKFVAFYLLAGIAATLAQTFVDPNEATPTLGASGAIAGTLGAYALLYPRARVVTLVFIIFFVTVFELPALLVLGAWFVLQLSGATALDVAGAGVAYWAHIGGFLFGLATIKLFASRYRDDYVQPRLPVY